MTAIYLINTPTGNRLVKAKSAAAAINFAVKKDVTAAALKASELVDHLAAGLTVEDATAVKGE